MDAAVTAAGAGVVTAAHALFVDELALAVALFFDRDVVDEDVLIDLGRALEGSRLDIDVPTGKAGGKSGVLAFLADGSTG